MNANTICSCPTGADESDDSGPACTAEPPPATHDADDADQPPPAAGNDRDRCDAALVELCDETDDATLDRDWLCRHLEAAARTLEQPVARVGLIIVNDSRMTALHVEHRGTPGTTDVLTYDLSEPGEPIDVDVVVCIDEAARQATPRSHTVERELLLYGIHGLLHCAGFDDTTPEQFEAMHRREDEILERIGVGRTFENGSHDAGDAS